MHVKPENLRIIDSHSDYWYALLKESKVNELLSEARKLLAVDPNDINVCQVASRYLIDGGTDVGDLEAINEGMILIEKILESNPNII